MDQLQNKNITKCLYLKNNYMHNGSLGKSKEKEWVYIKGKQFIAIKPYNLFKIFRSTNKIIAYFLFHGIKATSQIWRYL